MDENIIKKGIFLNSQSNPNFSFLYVYIAFKVMRVANEKFPSRLLGKKN
jgi:hypothetical protein